MNQVLIDYIKKQLDQGISKEEITNKLISQGGWSREDVEQSFATIFPPEPEVPTPEPEVVAPEPEVETPLPGEIRPEKKTSKFFVAAVVAISLLVIGGGAFGYFYQKNRETPEVVFQKMLAQLAELKSVEFDGSLQLDVESFDSLLGDDAANFLMDFSGGVDSSKGFFSFKVSSNMEALSSPISVDFRMLDQIAYLKIDQIPDIGFFDLSSLSDQWISFESETTEEEEVEQPNDEQVKKIKQAALRSNALQLKEKLDNQKIGEVETYHYEFSINKENLKQLSLEIAKITEQELDEEDIAELDRAIEELELLGGEIWIGKSDYLPYKIVLNLKISTDDYKGEMILNLSMKNHNGSITIEAPESAKSFMELFMEPEEEEMLDEEFEEFKRKIQSEFPEED